MIIVKLIGGLGNQMFQYAVGRRLAHGLNVTLKLDVSAFQQYTLRKYELGAFNIEENFAADEEVAQLTVREKGLLEILFSRLLGKPLKPLPSFIKEKHFDFDPNILDLPDNVYLDGYWQSEKYFSDIDSIIRQDFTVKYPASKENEELYNEIASRNSVGLHIRRGDYVSSPLTNQVHGVCSIKYYNKAVRYITQKIPNCHFYIFSDDHPWVHENFKLNYPATLVNYNNASKSYEDLRLMSLCRHNIIANSSFSWWGAWLNSNPDKIVVSPERWFNDPPRSVKDLIPESWVRM